MSKSKSVEWRCQNYDGCVSADSKTVMELPFGTPFTCPDCGSNEGIEIIPDTPFPWKPVLLGCGAFLLVGLAFPLLSGKRKPGTNPRKLTSVSTSKPVSSQPKQGFNALVDNRTGLPKQVLVRPQSLLHPNKPAQNAADEASKDAAGRKLPDFKRLYVFKNSDPGWLQVGDTLDNPSGWLAEKDSIDWPHSLIVEYTSPLKRRPVLFYKEKNLPAAIMEEAPQRNSEVDGYYRQIQEVASGAPPPPDDYPIICVEPQDKISAFYLLPVLAAEEHYLDGKLTRLLQVTAAGKKRGTTRVQDPGYVAKAMPLKDRLVQTAEVPVDIVFVVDMTGSMQPWVDGVRNVMTNIAKQIQSAQRTVPVMMGFWGYKDDPGIPGIDFRTKNFTKDLVTPAEFPRVVTGLKVNKVTNDSYPEDVFSGVLDAISNQTAWRSDATKIVILIGDAPGHSSVREGGRQDTNAAVVRQKATDEKVNIVAVQIQDFSHKSYEQWHKPTSDQFHILGKNGNLPPAHLTISSKAPSPFENQLSDIISELVAQRSIKSPDRSPGSATPKSEGTKIAEGFLAAAKVEQVSEAHNQAGEVEVPRDFTGWVMDRELSDPEIMSLEAKLLVTKNELGTLQQTVSSILQKAKDNVIVGGSFVDDVLGIVAQTASGQGNSKTLAGIVPAFIKGLPYKSELMEKPASWWGTRTQEQQQDFIRDLEAKLGYYQGLNEDPSKWRPLNSDDEAGAMVTALPLAQLP